ncbi:DNA-binding NarL/FixJ family response regulator [Hydrogenispora ethanolica]|jgi:DNA-binding NarL/FixJ family response regulator|uniref:DNA-binding NarL/FixJ family response regulator n=1 Tax=Hydrogenispora ethanolica TaxID=1082276 RepID=A0A4R1R8C0_HYDET|nr:response regulator transcription factor [Hydrogenispora ethanolica]TCL61886.1 DNA-binding NarL/FixJ family response regulator [Hydrogenispora ethanolica]
MSGTPLIRVIVAEDLAVFREHFTAVINQQADLRVVAGAANGRQAVQLAAEWQPDVVLMDIEMDHKRDGIEAAQAILAAQPGIKIVFLTVHEDDETVFSAFENGAVDYVLKSSPPEEIIAAIRLAHQGHSPIRPEVAAKIRNEFSRIRKNESNLLQSVYILSQLTPSEKEILNLLLQGMRPAEIADSRQVELSTVKSQINVLLKKFNKKRTKEVVRLIKELNLNDLFYQHLNG